LRDFEMKMSAQIWRTVAVSVTALLIIVVIFFGHNSAMLSNTLDRVRLEKESMLSENIHLNRNLEELRKEVNDVTENNRQLIKILDRGGTRIKEKIKR
jgi:hypothetical protein